MKILALRFKNLNSLVGEWSIDFRHPAYLSDGIFAITGPTGAGKSTILDAIALALYGRTPRLASVSQGSNEIMSRQTGECFAEVLFETPAGRFRCHWSQRKARRKSDGVLQSPQHELADGDGGTIVESSIRGVAREVERVTGMDFDRFTRSMLLAQGGFAAFLQASPGERAPVLEQLTGTEIYSRISMVVHQFLVALRSGIEQKEAGLAGLQRCSPEEVAELECRHASVRVQEEELGVALGVLRQSITWLGDVARLEAKVQQYDAELLQLHGEREAFVPLQQRLDSARKALALRAAHAGLEGHRLRLRETQQQLEMTRGSVNSAAAELVETETLLVVAHDCHEKARQRQQQLLVMCRQVRELDIRIAAGQTGAATVAESVTLKKEAVALLHEESRNLADRERDVGEALQQVEQELVATAGDAGLVASLAEIRSRCNSLDQHRRILEAESHSHQLEVAACSEARRNLSVLVAERQHWQEAAAVCEHAYRSAEVLLSEGFDGVTAGSLSLRLSEHQERLGLLRRLVELEFLVQEAMKLQQRMIGQRDQVLDQLQQEQQQGDTLAGKQQQLERDIAALEDQLEKQNRFAAFDAARQQLRSGEPCPLCGAVEHPYALHYEEEVDVTRQQLDGLRLRRTALGDALLGNRQMQARFEALLQQAEQGLLQQKERIAQLTEEAAQTSTAVAAAGMPLVLDATTGRPLQLPELLQDAERVEATIKGELMRYDELAARKEQCRNDVEQARQQSRTGSEACRAAELQLGHLGEQLRRIAARCRELRRQELQLTGELLGLVAPYGIGPDIPDPAVSLVQQLEVRHQAWIDGERRQRELRQQDEANKLNRAHMADRTDVAECALQQLEQELGAVSLALHDLQQQRQALFGDRDPDREEAAAEVVVAEAAEQRDGLFARQSALRQELKLRKERMSELEASLVADEAREQELLMDFSKRVLLSGFVDRDHFLRCDIVDEERLQLEEQELRLRESVMKLQTRRDDAEEQLVRQRARALTEATLETLEQQQQESELQLREVRLAIGAIEQQLEEQRRLEQEHRSRLDALEALRHQHARWNQLHQLIGSADGKKFRNFAQGLTFDLMIAHANRQLLLLTDRYLLMHDLRRPLELEVVDRYQAGEIRSTKNLSGGESFLVSLALALGLSQMASHKVPLDSLFLDEGFGTLDEDALEMALDALERLHETGKLIGVISHVAALKERIATRIEVMPLHGGRSRLSGPGTSLVGV